MEEQGTPVFSYSPDRRTALVLCGTGAHGAYQAGVLRAVQEAGVKIDLIAGQGIGAATAALGAIDGGSCLWDANGLWQSKATSDFYGWKPLLRVAGWMAAALALVLLIPLFVLLIGLVVFLIGFLLTLLGIGAGHMLTEAYASTLNTLFANQNLPTIVPRLAMAVLALLIVVSAGGVLVAQWRAPVKRRAEGGWWWRLVGSPLDAARVRETVAGAVWQLIRGAAATSLPATSVLGRRYGEVLAENLGQPGFRELIVAATDLDARRDVVAFLLRDDYTHEFMAPRPGRDRRTEVIDLAGIGREHAFDVINAAVTPPLVCDPALVKFSSESFWRGETHRLCDRPGLSTRLLEEVAAAGVTQVLIVTAATATAGPHRLAPPRLDIRNRLGDFMTAAETAALRDALTMARLRFDGVYVVCPSHNAIGPFDFGGAYDAASDRRETVRELMQHGYDDAYRQFIEPVVGASGEQLAHSGEMRLGLADDSPVMTIADCDRSRAPEILAILNDAIEHSTALYDYRPRPLSAMDSWFDAKERGAYPVIGAIDPPGRLLGFASYGPFRAWPAYKYSVEHSVYVAPESRGQGVGKALLAAVLERARMQQYHNVIGGIDADNAVSIALHERFGFERCGLIRHAGFKFGRWLDLAFYQKLLDTPAEPRDG